MTDHRSGPWRLLVLDRSEHDDPRWLLCTVAAPADVRPAEAAEEAPDEVAARWLRGRNGGQPHTLTELRNTRCWRVDRGADG
jgi:hypothetical protein